MVLCTKLVQWLVVAGTIGTVWLGLVTQVLPLQLSPRVMDVVIPFPVYLVVCFGCYALSVVGLRLMTFNDCEAAARELVEEIKQAKRDLIDKGMQL